MAGSALRIPLLDSDPGQKNACGALYVILMYYSPSSLGFEPMLSQSTGDYTHSVRLANVFLLRVIKNCLKNDHLIKLS